MIPGAPLVRMAGIVKRFGPAGRGAGRVAVHIRVSKLLFTPSRSVTRENSGVVDLSTARAPAGWKPR